MNHRVNYHLVVIAAIAWVFQAAAIAAEPGLVGHWKLQGDCRDYSGQDNHGINHGVKLDGGVFDGRSAYVEIPASDSLKLGTGDFTLAAWVHTEEQLNDVLGDIVSKFDPASRRGFNWSIKDGHGATGSQANFRNLQFGVDAASEPKWHDCGRPGNAVYVMAMAVYDGELFVGTCEAGDNEKGHVYRYAGGKQWIDCGSPDASNAVTALAVHHGKLYAGTGHYRRSGSALIDSLNTSVGGRILRYESDGNWIDCGQVGDADAIGGMSVFRGELYATSMYSPAFFRYAGGRQWLSGPLPSNGKLVTALGVYNGNMYAASWAGCDIYRFDGQQWSDPVHLEPTGQTYSLAVHAGELYTGTWRNGRVYRSGDGKNWMNTGRLGQELEVMGMAVHNGKLYAGTLPLAEVYRYDGDSHWTSTGRLDHTPSVRYRRAWTMAVFQGRLFCGTLPSGHVHALDVGCNVSYDHELAPGWRHLAAVRQGARLELFVDGKQVAKSSSFEPTEYDLSTDQPLRIGFGQTDYFNGKISDVRIYNRALTEAQIQQFAGQVPAVANKTKAANIVVAANASRIDKFAAAELQRCLAAALGWNASISEGKSASSDGPVFFVGSLDSNMAGTGGFPSLDDKKVASLKEDGICLQGDGKNVALVGKGPRGGLNAVYEFLEKQVGIHWPEPGREHVPNLESLDLQLDHVHNPAFRYRGISLVRSPSLDVPFHAQIIDWVAKNRLNTCQFSCETYELLRPKILEAVLDRGTTMKIGGHSREFFYAGAKYFPANPDHFALVKGKRTGQSQLCYSNHASVAEFVDNIIAYLKTRPEIGMVALWPSDGYGFCECPRCKAGSTTDILLDYINDSSERIHAHLPQMKVEFLSYIHYTVPPEKTKPLPYVVPTYCEYWSRNQFHPITDDRAGNAKCQEQLESWVKASSEATVYSYYADDSMKRFLYNPVSDVVFADLRYYQRIGAAGSSVLMMNPQSWWSNAQHMYCYARASWDAAATLAEIDDDYFRSLYGPAAKPMQAHQQAARDLFDTEFGHGQTGEEMLFGFRIKKFNPAHEASSNEQFADAVEKVRSCLDEAKATSADPYVLKRIEILDQDAQLMGHIYGIVSEAAGYKLDQTGARKDRMHALIASVSTNEVADKEDFRCKVLKSLMPHVTSVLGAEEAAKYDRVPESPPE